MSLGQGVRHFCSRWLSANSFVLCLPSLSIAIKMSLSRELAKFEMDVQIRHGLCTSYVALLLSVKSFVVCWMLSDSFDWTPSTILLSRGRMDRPWSDAVPLA